MIYAIFAVVMLIVPYALLKTYEIYKVKKNKKWSDEPIDVDSWKFTSNYM